MAIRFSEDEVRPMGLVAAGVGGIKLQGRDELAGMELVPEGGELLFVASDGKAKRVSEDQFPVQGRYGVGVLAWKLPRTSQVVSIAALAAAGSKKRKTAARPDGEGLPGAGQASAMRAGERLTLHLEKLAPKAIRPDEAPLQGRTAAGKSLVEVKAGDRLVAVTIPWSAPYAPPGPAPAPREDAPENSGPASPAANGSQKPTRARTARAAPASPSVAKEAADGSAAQTPASSDGAGLARRKKSTASAAAAAQPASKPARRSTAKQPAATAPAKPAPVKKATASKVSPAESDSAPAPKTTVRTASKTVTEAATASTTAPKTATKTTGKSTSVAGGGKPAETRPAEKKPAERKPAKPKPAESKPAERKPAQKASKDRAPSTAAPEPAPKKKTAPKK
jgi:hypothetical protein